MAIKLENAKLSINFPYEDDNGKQYEVRYYFDEGTRAYVVSIMDVMNSQTSIFPVNALVEIIDFLKQRKLVGPADAVVSNSAPINNVSSRGTIIVDAPRTRNILPMPTINNQPAIPITNQTKVAGKKQLPIQSFSPPEKGKPSKLITIPKGTKEAEIVKNAEEIEIAEGEEDTTKETEGTPLMASIDGVDKKVPEQQTEQEIIAERKNRVVKKDEKKVISRRE